MKSHPPPRIGVSACMSEGEVDPLGGRSHPLLSCEVALAHYLQGLGAVVYVIPSAPSEAEASLAEACRWLDGLVLHGGVDVSPTSYGEQPLKDEWRGDAKRDRYELALIRHFLQQRKPILGICRGLQILNVAFGGSLFQDIATFHPHSQVQHRVEQDEGHSHEITLVEGNILATLYPGSSTARVNSIHHQAVKDLGRGLVVEARSSQDDIIEAIALPRKTPSDPFCLGVQWHPEYQDHKDAALLDSMVLLRGFTEALLLSRTP